MTLQDDFRRYLEAADIDGCRRLWHHVFPNMPQAPKDDVTCLAQIHMARTQTNSIHFRLRAYSHRWLVDHGFPSALPDRLKPSAERMYPRIVEAVGIAVVASSTLLKPVAARIERAMADAVEDAFASGRRDKEFVSARMQEARNSALRYYGDLIRDASSSK